ncbi:DUF2306 domain-containing protein [uncultured Brevundimonas sp.]|uniref:DUF2306 domain-containing protein n=1 Tax=uncultured Brevundimonas sp. TaxID=213418 RepID=UPI0030EE373F|tara:strand:+ start:4774 stop:5343 length:570 start_codon:yes stop_codon:yes gene_type:complete
MLTDPERPSLSSLTRLTRRPLRRPGGGALVGAGIVAAILAWYLVSNPQGLAGLSFEPHGPNISLLRAQPVTVRLHIAAALTALMIGIVLLAGVKGNTLHRTLGWTWVAAMMTTAVSSFFIRTINPGTLSWIHLISGWVVIALPMGVYAARRHRVAVHRRAMTGLFVGGLLITGGLTFLPGRLMWRVVFG